MIVVTGGAGFIGSALVWKLNQLGRNDIVIVDRLGTSEKWKNLVGLDYLDFYDKEDFINWIRVDEFEYNIDVIFHLGACSSTTEKDADYLMENNFGYTQTLAEFAIRKQIRFIYASSAATYGDGSNGYEDDEEQLEKLRPMNMYGYSKHLFDLYAKKEKMLNQIVGLKYFNVYGPNEYHKGDMRSVVHKAYEQIKENGKVRLFKSYKEEYKDGEQLRDFIYVKDAVDITLFFMENKNINGIFNVGTGKARTWNDLVSAIFNAMDKPVNIEYIEMPENLKNKYQYFTQADLKKLRDAGYDKEITSLEKGVEDYVKNYLLKDKTIAW